MDIRRCTAAAGRAGVLDLLAPNRGAAYTQTGRDATPRRLAGRSGNPSNLKLPRPLRGVADALEQATRRGID